MRIIEKKKNGHWATRPTLMNIKKVQLNCWVDPATKSELERQSEVEERRVGNLGGMLLSWATRQMTMAGNSLALIQLSAVPLHDGPNRIKRLSKVSPETQSQLHEALGIILERAPSAEIERVTDFLNERAGKYGEGK